MAPHNMHTRLLATIIVFLFASSVTWAADKPPLRDGMENFIVHAKPKDAKDIEFTSAKDGKIRLSTFKGKWVLLNFWATWCAPCRREMTDLDHLQAGLGGKNFQVVALSTDRQGLPRVMQFYKEMKLTHLEKYVGQGLKTGQPFRVLGLPVTILLDRQGKEVGRMVGPADWNGPAARALINHYLAKN